VLALRLVITAPWGARLGGAEQMLWGFLRRVDRTRFEPIVVFLQPGSFVAEVESLGTRAVVISTGRTRNVLRTGIATFELARLLRRERPGLVLDWSTKSHVIGGLAALAAGYRRRSAWWQHGFASRGLIDRAAAALPAQAVFCPSEAAAAAQRLLWPRRRTVVVYPFVDEPPEAPERDARETLGIPAGRFVVGICGRLQPWKRQDLVLQAVDELVRRGHDAHALIVGGDAHGLSPEYGPALRRYVREHALEDRATFTGHVAGAGAYIAAMDVLVNASAAEPFGMTLLEAMALAVPVVAYAAGGPIEIVEPEVSGILLEGEPKAALVAALERLASGPELRRRLAGGGRERFETQFAPDRLVARLEAEIEQLAAGGR
jgi:glycosyltransferase involved in cell wall biosynthesis